METGFSVEGARSKRAVEQDQPAQEPMRVQKLRRNPDNGQKKVRRQMQRKTAAEDRKSHSTTCPQCGAKDIHTRVWPDGSRLDAWCDNCHWKGTKTRKTKESTVDFNQREAEILTAMGRATLPEQQRLAVELGQVRAQRAAALEADREIDVSSAVIRDHLTPVAVHTMNTTATDWLDDAESGEITDPEGIVQAMRTEASLWFGRVGAEVKADREEFAEQAQGYAHHAASAFGMGADIARRAFLDAVGHLHTADSAVVVEPLPDSAPGPQNDQTAPWTTQETTGDSNTDASAQVEEHTSSLRAQAYASHQTHSLISQSALRVLADDSPGKVDEDQSGNAESQITDYDTMGNDPEPFDEKMNGPLQPTGPFAVPSTRAPNVQGSLRPIAVIAAEIDINSVPPNAQPYLAAMDALTTVDDSFGPQDDGRTIVSYFLANAPGIAQEAELRTHVAMTLEEARAAKEAFLAELRAVTAGDPQSGQAQSHDSEVAVGNPNDRPMWPWETPLIGDEGASGTDGTASNVADVPTPGGESGYPQPKRGSLNVQAGFPICAAGCNTTLSAADKLVDTPAGLAHASCMERSGAGVDNFGDKKAPPFGSEDDSEKESSLGGGTPFVQAVQEGGEQHTAATEWRVIQRGTGTRGNQVYENQEAAEAAASSLNEEHGTNDFLAKELGVVAAYNPLTDPNTPYNSPKKPTVEERQWREQFPEGVPLHGDLTPDQQRVLRRRSFKVRELEGRSYEATCPNPDCEHHGVSFVHDDLAQDDDDEAVCPTCETPLAWHNHTAGSLRRRAALQSQGRLSDNCLNGNHTDCHSSSCSCPHHSRVEMSGACSEGDHSSCKMSHDYSDPNACHCPHGTHKSASLQKGAPFAGYKDFDACVAANQDKRNPEAYCGKIKHQVEGAASHKVHPNGVVEVFDHDAYRKEKTYYDEAHDKVIDHSRIATDGQCGRSWDDAVATSWTPAPSGRCPFEYEHHTSSQHTAAPRKPNVPFQIKWLVNRIHVGTSDEDVEKDFRSRCEKAGHDEPTTKKVVDLALKQHHYNQGEYTRIMGSAQTDSTKLSAFRERVGASLKTADAPDYNSRSARDAMEMGYGNKDYWDYLDQHAQELHDKFKADGDHETANSMFTRTLSESLQGNEGD